MSTVEKTRRASSPQPDKLAATEGKAAVKRGTTPIPEKTAKLDAGAAASSATKPLADTLPGVEKVDANSTAAITPQITEQPVTSSVATSFSIKKNFEALATKFDGLDEVVKKRTQAREEEQKKFDEIREEIEKVRLSVKEETGMRVEAIKAMRAWYEEKFATWRTEIEQPLISKIDTLSKNVDTLSARLTDVQARAEKDRQEFPKQIATQCGALITQLAEFKLVFQAAERDREQKDTATQKKIAEAEYRLRQEITAERTHREEADAPLKQAIDQERTERRKGADLLKRDMDEKVTELAARIVKESRTREDADAECVQAINHFSSALQDAIRKMVEYETGHK